MRRIWAPNYHVPPGNDFHLPLGYLPRGLVPESGGVVRSPWNFDRVVDFPAFRSFLSLHGTLPPLSERGAFHALPPRLQDTILGFFLVNGRRRGDGRRRLVPRGVDLLVVGALVDLEREEREERWRERAWDEEKGARTKTWTGRGLPLDSSRGSPSCGPCRE